ncbi:MAG: family 10 glycosylhydrolase [Bacteroidota bacterium]
MLRSLLVLLLLSTGVTNAQSQKYEFRGAWIATVANLDWPLGPGLSTAAQQSQLLTILDDLQSVGVNAVVFQVRSEADAFYDSPFEPWSYWLTGEQGRAPEPFYDPLAFAVEEAHARGMELHAWINPYRADRGSAYPNSADHVTNTHPEWILSFSSGIQILDPGLPEVRDRVASIVADIARRYDVDGIHYDDYFYPYPSTGFSGITNEDDATFAAHSRGFTNRGDWRRDNVNLLVGQIQDSLQTVRPDVVHGVSPFGIWRNGVPQGISGLDAYNVVYADAVAWLDAQDVDYVAPQLYWSSQRSFDADGDGDLDFNRQRFTTLAPWWASVSNDRHLYPGVATYRIGAPGYEADEVPTQLRFTRGMEGAQGTILFRARAGLTVGGLGLADSLQADLYRRPALTPSMGWKSQEAPRTPGTLSETWEGEDLTLTWSAPASGDAEARRYAIYRIPSPMPPTFPDALMNPEHLIAVSGETTITDRPVMASFPWTYVVTAVSTNSIESAPTNAVVVDGRAVANEPLAGGEASLLAPRPNPTAGQAQIVFSLAAPGRVSLRVLDVLGREVARLADDEIRQAGRQSIYWDGRTVSGGWAASGTYLVALETENGRLTQALTLVR